MCAFWKRQALHVAAKLALLQALPARSNRGALRALRHHLLSARFSSQVKSARLQPAAGEALYRRPVTFTALCVVQDMPLEQMLGADGRLNCLQVFQQKWGTLTNVVQFSQQLTPGGIAAVEANSHQVGLWGVSGMAVA